MRKGFDRTQRVADLLQKALAKILMEQDLGDQFSLVTITGVNVSRDLSYARVYVSVLLDETHEIKHVVQSLNRSAKGLRYQLAREVDLRIIPELKFVYDESTAHGFRISDLIDSAVKKSEKK